jgi:ATP-dependent Clp protease ATP-binding subunit ClpX
MKTRNASCSFCRKSFQDVGPLVEGPDSVYICSECVSLCQSIIEQETRRREAAADGGEPQNVLATLDKLVAGQEYVKAVLAEAAYGATERGARLLLVGSSQSAAMYFAKALAYACAAPFFHAEFASVHAKADRTAAFEGVLHGLLAASDFDLEAAQRGIVFVDGTERQDIQDLLHTFWTGSIADPLGDLQLDARRVLFVCAGTFQGLDEAISALGRHPEQPVSAQALIASGASPRWAETLTAIARVRPLDEQTLTRLIGWVDFRRALGGCGR